VIGDNRRYRARQRSVTDHGLPGKRESGHLHVVRERSAARFQPRDWRCHFCGQPASAFVRLSPLRPARYRGKTSRSGGQISHPSGRSAQVHTATPPGMMHGSLRSPAGDLGTRHPFVHLPPDFRGSSQPLTGSSSRRPTAHGVGAPRHPRRRRAIARQRDQLATIICVEKAAANHAAIGIHQSAQCKEFLRVFNESGYSLS
jgi:hypothetical protein